MSLGETAMLVPHCRALDVVVLLLRLFLRVVQPAVMSRLCHGPNGSKDVVAGTLTCMVPLGSAGNEQSMLECNRVIIVQPYMIWLTAIGSTQPYPPPSICRG